MSRSPKMWAALLLVVALAGIWAWSGLARTAEDARIHSGEAADAWASIRWRPVDSTTGNEIVSSRFGIVDTEGSVLRRDVDGRECSAADRPFRRGDQLHIVAWGFEPVVVPITGPDLGDVPLDPARGEAWLGPVDPAVEAEAVSVRVVHAQFLPGRRPALASLGRELGSLAREIRIPVPIARTASTTVYSRHRESKAFLSPRNILVKDGTRIRYRADKQFGRKVRLLSSARMRDAGLWAWDVRLVPDYSAELEFAPDEIDALKIWLLDNRPSPSSLLDGSGLKVSLAPIPYHCFSAAGRSGAHYTRIAADATVVDIDILADPKPIRGLPRIDGVPPVAGSLIAPDRLDVSALDFVEEAAHAMRGLSLHVQPMQDWTAVRLPENDWLTVRSPSRAVAYLRWRSDGMATGRWEAGRIVLALDPGWVASGEVSYWNRWEGRGAVRTGSSSTRPIRVTGAKDRIVLEGVPAGHYLVHYALELHAPVDSMPPQAAEATKRVSVEEGKPAPVLSVPESRS